MISVLRKIVGDRNIINQEHEDSEDCDIGRQKLISQNILTATRNFDLRHKDNHNESRKSHASKVHTLPCRVSDEK